MNTEALVRGDNYAFAQLYKRYHSLVYQIVRNVLAKITYCLPKGESTQDLVQDVFIQLWVKRERFADVKNIAGYINLVAKNTACDHIQKWVTRYNASAGSYYADQHVDNAAIGNMARENLYAAIKELPDMCGEIVLLIHRDGYTPREICQLKGCDSETVYNRGAYALRRLRTIFDRDKL